MTVQGSNSSDEAEDKGAAKPRNRNRETWPPALYSLEHSSSVRLLLPKL